MLHFTRLVVHNHNQAFALLHGYLDGLLQTFVSTFHCHAVNHHFNVVGLITVHLHALFDFLYLAIDTYMQIAFLAHRFKQFTIMALATAYQWGKYQNLSSGIVVLDHINDLLLGVFHHLFAGFIAISLACTSKKQTHIVVNLGGGTYRRTRILVGGLLFNTDDR